MSDKIDELYDQQFGEADYNRVIIILWEEYNSYHQFSWPPSKQMVRDRIEKIRYERSWDDRAPGS